MFVGPQGRTNPFRDAEWQAIVEATWANSNAIVIPVLIKDAAAPPFLQIWVHLKIDPDNDATWTDTLMEAVRQCQPISGIRVAAEMLERQEIERQQRLDSNAGAVKAMQD